MVALQVKRIPGGAVLMFLIELAFGNLFDHFLGSWFFRWNLVLSMEVGFSDGSCSIGIFFGGGGHPSSSEFCFLTPVFGQFHMRVQAVLAFQITRSLFFWVLPVSLGPMEGS